MPLCRTPASSAATVSFISKIYSILFHLSLLSFPFKWQSFLCTIEPVLLLVQSYSGSSPMCSLLVAQQQVYMFMLLCSKDINGFAIVKVTSASSIGRPCSAFFFANQQNRRSFRWFLTSARGMCIFSSQFRRKLRRPQRRDHYRRILKSIAACIF